jgi:hypothetical protein
MYYQTFESYPVSGAQIRAAADDTRDRLASVRSVVTEVEGQHRTAVEAVEGELERTVANAPSEVVTRADVLNREAEYAVGCLELFAAAIDRFNFADGDAYPRSVSRLNDAWATAAGNGFGVSYDVVVSDATPAAYERTRADYVSLFAAARDETTNRLRQEYNESHGLVDDAATDISIMLHEGPVEANVQRLWAAGSLPFHAPLLFTDSDLTGTPTTPAVAASLETYLDAHPDEREDPLMQVLQSTVVEPMPSQEEIDDSLERLREAGLLDEDEEPDGYYLGWLTWSLRKGLDPSDIVERAEQEEVTMERFDPLRELDTITDPTGRMFFILEDDNGAKDVARLTELLHGGTPSVTDVRRSNNEWTYDGWGTKILGLNPPSDLERMRDSGAVVVATPEGTMLAAPGPDGSPFFVGGSGTTWMEMFVLNDSFDDPEDSLRIIIERGSRSRDPDGHPLAQLLLHERLHAAQWGRYGQFFKYRYIIESGTGGTEGYKCGNDHESDAVFDWGGYEECTEEW